MRSLFVAFMFIFCLAPAAAAQGRAVTLTGQVVCCTDCWVRADRKVQPYGTRADLERAAECVANGDPTLLAVTDADESTTFYELAEGKFKKPGKNWLALVGSRVQVTGAVRERKGGQQIKVDALTTLAAAQQDAGSAVGRVAELALADLSGVEQKLSAYRGRIVVLNFWATYCVPCRKEMPDLASVQNQYAALGVQVIGASADTAEDRDKVLQFIRETKLNFPVWLGATTEDMARFGLGPALPGTAVIGRDGKVVWVTAGVVSEAELRKQVDALLARAEAAPAARATKAGTRDTSSVPS